MSIVFFGTPRFSVPTLQALVKQKESIPFVVTQPDKKGGRGKQVSPPPVKVYATEQGIAVLQPETLNDPLMNEKLEAVKPEFIIVVAYGKILRKHILTSPMKGCINVHASLLPHYRGAAPVQWAIINGESITGVTTMLMDEGLDTGDILLQRKSAITIEDTADILAERLSILGAELVLETIAGLRQNSISPVPQSGPVSYAPLLRKEDGRIDWNQDAESLFNFIRGMFSWPCAFSYFKGKYIRIHDTRPLAGTGKPGEIVRVNDAICVGTKKGLLALRSLQPEGKKALDARAFANGYGLKKGDRFD